MEGLSLMPTTSRCGSPARVPFKKPEYVGRQRDHQNYLALKTKNTAIEIKKREEMRENRSITRELLIQKFINKYGPRMKRRIVQQVDALMATKHDGDVTNEEEKKLEEAIITFVNDSNLCTSRTDSSELLPIRTSNSTSQLPPPLKIPNPTNSSDSPTIRGESCATPIPMGTEWEAVRLYHAYLAEKKQKAQELQQIQRKKELSDQLSQQVKENELRKEREREEERLAAEFAKREYEKYREQSNVKDAQKEKEIKELRESWEQQISLLKAHLETERAKNIAAHQAELDELSAALAEEERVLMAQKLHNQQFNESSNQLYAQSLSLKSLQKQQEIAADKQTLDIFLTMQDERDAHRYDDIRKSMERVNKLLDWAEVSFPRPVTPSEYINQKVDRELHQIREIEQQREAKEKDNRMKLDKLTRDINKELIDQREREKFEERMKDRELNELMQEESRKLQELKAEMRRIEKEKKKELGETLQKQSCQSLSGGTGPRAEVMTPVEREMNKVALDAVRTDPVLNSLFQSRVSHRMRMSGGLTARSSALESGSEFPSARPSTRGGNRSAFPVAGGLPGRPTTSHNQTKLR